MILALDIGNTNIVAGCIEDGNICMMVRATTDRLKTGDEYAMLFYNLLNLHHIDIKALEGTIISCVVPVLSHPIRSAIEKLTGRPPLMVGAGLKTGLNIVMDNPGQLGADLVVDAVAASARYELPIIIFDMGTATTMSLINEKGNYVGGMIIPGAALTLDALSNRASQLPHVGIDNPKSLIGTNTIDCMRSGIVYSNAAMIDGLIQRVNETLSKPASVVATGGLAGVIVPYCREKVVYDKNLLLHGLWLLYCKNKGK